MPEHNGQKGELLPIEEVGKLLHGKQSDNHETLIPLTQAQCRLALKPRVRTLRDHLFIAEYLTQATFCEQETPLLVG